MANALTPNDIIVDMAFRTGSEPLCTGMYYDLWFPKVHDPWFLKVNGQTCGTLALANCQAILMSESKQARNSERRSYDGQRTGL